jgi:hypothetical protein
VFGASAVAQRSEGLRRRARVMQYRREPDVRQEIECSFGVRSAAEFGSVDTAGGRHRRQAECETARRRQLRSHLPPAAIGRVIVRERRRPAAFSGAVAHGGCEGTFRSMRKN